jgi:hypothetical protein
MVESTGQLPFHHQNGNSQVREMSADVRSASFFAASLAPDDFTRS